MSENNDDTTVVTISNHTASDLLIADDGAININSVNGYGTPDYFKLYGIALGDWVLYKDHSSMELELAIVYQNQVYPDGTYMYGYNPRIYIHALTGPNSSNYKLDTTGDVPVTLLEISIKHLTKVPKNSTLETARLLYGKSNP